MFQIILLFVMFVLSFVYFRGRYNESYWKKRGVVFYERNKLLGVFWDFMMGEKAMFEVFRDLYVTYNNEPAVGIGSLTTPALYVIDPRNVHHVLQLDFQSFSHRGIEPNPGDLLADNVLFMNGPRWKLMRQKMTPLFTAAKLRNMFYIMDRSAQDFVQHLRDNPQKLKGNGFDTVNEFCSAAIAAAVFGIGTESTFDSPFLRMARNAFQLNWKTHLRFAINNMSTPLSKALGVGVFDFKDQEKLFIPAFKQVLRAREKDNVKKHDFIDIALSLQKAGTMRDLETGQVLEPTDELLAAQGFFFFVAGVEPTATAIFSILIELGQHPEILKKLQREIDETMEKYEGNITYDVVSDMKYLDQVLNEALRVHTPVGFLSRQCVRDSVLPVGDIRISEGTRLFVPIYDLHFDPKYFPEPEVFDPERFALENRPQHEMAYLPFGKGGRACIGLRYARLQVMAGLLHLLRNYDVVSYANTSSRKYSKGQFQVRRIDMDIELIPRKL